MKLPIISGMDVIKALSKIGFRLTRQSGSHMVLVRKSAEKISKEKITVVVPKHRELAKGTLLSIISQAGLSKEEFLRLLKE